MAEEQTKVTGEGETEDLGPPAFEKLPDWFQAEIDDENCRRGVELDTRRCHSNASLQKIVLAGAMINVAVLWFIADLDLEALLLMAFAGGLCGFLCLKFEVSRPTGVLIAGALNLPSYFLINDVTKLTGMAAVAYFYTCLFLIVPGVVLANLVANERTERLPY